MIRISKVIYTSNTDCCASFGYIWRVDKTMIKKKDFKRPYQWFWMCSIWIIYWVLWASHESFSWQQGFTNYLLFCIMGWPELASSYGSHVQFSTYISKQRRKHFTLHSNNHVQWQKDNWHTLRIEDNRQNPQAYGVFSIVWLWHQAQRLGSAHGVF